MGVDTIFTWDHFFPIHGDHAGKHFECLTTLASLAESTERAQIGVLVCCNSYRNPELLADAHRTVDHISGGRVILGIGAGWFRKDYDEYGYEFGDAPQRLRELRRALPRIEARLGKLNPPPLRPLPMLIGGAGEKVTLKLVARHADMWNSSGDVSKFRHKDEILRAHCEALGRDHTEIERTWSTGRMGPQELEELRTAGVTHFIAEIGGDGRGYDLSHLPRLVEWRDAQP